MLRTKLLLAIVLFAMRANAQSVGINTTGSAPSDPKAMLEIRKAGFSKLKIRTDSFVSDTVQLEFSNRNISNVGSDLRMSFINEEGLYVSSLSSDAAKTRDSLLSIRLNGNVGIGIRNPVYNMQLHNPSTNNTILSITNPITGFSNMDGMIVGLVGNSARVGNLEAGDLRFATSNLTRALFDAAGNFGIGNLTPAYKLDVAGDINFTGAMRVNGTPGTSGQVLTSNGTADPTWAETAFGNSIRFNVNFDETISSAGSTYLPITSDYNLNPAAIVIGSNSITVNTAGLYHFDLFVQYSGSYPTDPSATLTLSGTSIIFFKDEVINKRTSGGILKANWHYSFDIHLTAGRVIQLLRYVIGSGGGFSLIEGNLSGHLIKE